MLAIFVFLLLAGCAVEAQRKDPCINHLTCGTCIADNKDDCGWCSLPWQYKGGLQGGRCANAGKYRATCPGVVSTVNCIPGWKCNHTTDRCEEVTAGHGIPQSKCYEQCGLLPPTAPSMPGPTYLCNQTTFKCYKAPKGEHGFNPTTCHHVCHKRTPAAPSAPVPPDTCVCDKKHFKCHRVHAGTPGAVSCPICANSCQKQVNYFCNTTNYQCQKAKTGGYPKLECENQCTPLYVCDTSDFSCKIAPPPEPGVPLAKCNEECKPGNNTPGYLIGLWRGLQINSGYTQGEWDIHFDHNEIYVKGPNQFVFGGTTTFSGNPERRLIIVKITNSSDPINAPKGAQLELWYQFDGSTPETRFLMLCSGGPNGRAPKQWPVARIEKVGFDWTMTECEPLTSCRFRFRPGVEEPKHKIQTLSLIDDVQEPIKATPLSKKKQDPCTPYISCDTCLSHFVSEQCGWCSEPVVYPGGIKGGHCVQWNPSHNPFNCSGFRNFDCSDYECQQPQAICKKVPVGHGTNKTTCEKTCKNTAPPAPPTPPPPPPPPQGVVVCNHTTWKCDHVPAGTPNATSPLICQYSCYKQSPSAPAAPSIPTAPVPPMAPQPVALPWKCNHTTYHCQQVQPGTPGASGKSICEGGCFPPAPPPPPRFNGKYRGIQIDNQYKLGEFGLELKNGSYVLRLNGAMVSEGRIYVSGNRGNLFVQTNKPTQGLYAAIYSVNPGISVTHLTVVIGKDSTDIPSAYDKPWILGGKHGHEFLFFKV